MSDPLSIAAGIIGVATAAAQISVLLTKFTKSSIAAPQQAQVVLTEVSDIGGILSHLQSFLLGLDSPNRSRTCLLKVEKMVTIVSGCVLTFSELEQLLDQLKTEDLDVLDRLKWARKQSAISGLIQRLQNHKASLSLVLNILNGHTIAEAKDSVDQLHTLIEQFYKEMSSRVQALEVPDMQKRGDADWISGDDSEYLTTTDAYPPDLGKEEGIESEIVHFDFSDDLQRSRVYRRNRDFRTSVISALSNSVYSLGWSVFSDLSMAQVSNISMLNLAITEGEIFNPQRSSQTWSAQPNEGISTDAHTDKYGDRQRTQLDEIVRIPVPANRSSNARGSWPASKQTWQPSLRGRPPLAPVEERYSEDSESSYWPGGHFVKKTRARNTDDPVLKSTLPLVDPLDPQSPSQPQSALSQPREPMEDQPAYPCKVCGKILEEGKALRLDSNHWHVDCFRCGTCGKLLDSDSSLLLLVGGSLRCSNCTHSCTVCSSKIKDLAFVSGNQAICTTCFECRCCKRKIKNLKYARTSQGMFCMPCQMYTTELIRDCYATAARNTSTERYDLQGDDSGLGLERFYHAY